MASERSYFKEIPVSEYFHHFRLSTNKPFWLKNMLNISGYSPSTHTALFWHPCDVVWTLWTLYGHRNDVVCLRGFQLIFVSISFWNYFSDQSLLVPPRDDIKVKVSDISKAFEQSDEISRLVTLSFLFGV